MYTYFIFYIEFTNHILCTKSNIKYVKDCFNFDNKKIENIDLLMKTMNWKELGCCWLYSGIQIMDHGWINIMTFKDFKVDLDVILYVPHSEHCGTF